MSELTPNLLLIGVPKSATTGLANQLSSSPDVSIGITKEPGILSNRTYDFHASQVLFDSHFSSSTTCRYRLDATPWTFYEPSAPEKVSAFSASSSEPAKTILSLREPLSRVQSMYIDQVVRGREKRPFETAIRECMSQSDHRHLATSYIDTSLYGHHLQRWLEPATTQLDLKVVFFDDLVDADRAAVVTASLQRWLRLDLPGLERANSRSGRHPIATRPIDAAVAVGARLPPRLKLRVRGPLSGAARRLLRWSPSRPVPLPSVDIADHGLRTDLEILFASDIDHLSVQLSDDLVLSGLSRPGWMR